MKGAEGRREWCELTGEGWARDRSGPGSMGGDPGPVLRLPGARDVFG